MRAQLSKEVTDRYRSCLYVLSALKREGPSVAAAALEVVRPELQADEDEPDFLSPVVLMGRRMKTAVEHLVETDLELRSALAGLGVARQERDLRSDEAGHMIVGLRRVVLGHFVAPDLDGLALQPLSHRDPVTVLRRSQAIFEVFDGPDAEKLLGGKRFKAMVDVSGHASELREAVDEVRTLVESVHEIQRRIDRLRESKRERQDAYDALFLRTSRMFEELCHYAGREKLATQVRPSRRRPGRTEVEREGEGGETVSNGEGAELEGAATGLYSEEAKRSSPTVFGTITRGSLGVRGMLG